MKIENQLKEANIAIKNAQAILSTSTNQLSSNKNHESNLHTLRDLQKVMEKISRDTEKSMKGAKLAEARAKSRLMAVKKATSKTISHTAKAKKAAITSKKAAYAALITSKKMNSKPSHLLKKYHAVYKTQINAAIRAAKESEKQTRLALKSSKIARLSARIPLEPLRI